MIHARGSPILRSRAAGLALVEIMVVVGLLALFATLTIAAIRAAREAALYRETGALAESCATSLQRAIDSLEPAAGNAVNVAAVLDNTLNAQGWTKATANPPGGWNDWKRSVGGISFVAKVDPGPILTPPGYVQAVTVDFTAVPLRKRFYVPVAVSPSPPPLDPAWPPRAGYQVVLGAPAFLR